MVDRPETRISPDGKTVSDPERGEHRSRPGLSLAVGVIGGMLVGSASSLPIAVATGIEPLPGLLAALLVLGSVIGLLAARRVNEKSPPSLAQILHGTWSLLTVASALVLMTQVSYAIWLHKTTRRIADQEWLILAGTRASEVRSRLGEPSRIVEEGADSAEPGSPRPERWLYVYRFGRLPRFRMTLRMEDGKFQRSELDGIKGRRFLWNRPPG